jgi:hypothetical protein
MHRCEKYSLLTAWVVVGPQFNDSMRAMELKTIAKAPRRLNVEYDNSVTQCLKCRTVEPEEHTIARQWHGKHISMATNTPTTIEELWKAVFPAWSVLRLYNKL